MEPTTALHSSESKQYDVTYRKGVDAFDKYELSKSKLEMTACLDILGRFHAKSRLDGKIFGPWRPSTLIFRNRFGYLVSVGESNEQERHQVVCLLLGFEIAISWPSPICQNGFNGLLHACKDRIRDNDSIWFNKSIAMVTFLICFPCKWLFSLNTCSMWHAT